MVAMRKHLCSILILALALSMHVSSASCNEAGLCTGDDANIECLKGNFEELYKTNHEQFWTILNVLEERVISCNSEEDVASLLELTLIHQHSAEFTEFLSETIETLCAENTECLLSALSGLDNEIQHETIEYIKNPAFYGVEPLKDKLFKYKDDPRYKEIVQIYMEL